uniref:BHLH domain-containing protein n=1 Tax=Rhabditophanes sp. KR3021 TaxID=114890 RepID=A0AC35TY34_9BILA
MKTVVQRSLLHDDNDNLKKRKAQGEMKKKQRTYFKENVAKLDEVLPEIETNGEASVINKKIRKDNLFLVSKLVKNRAKKTLSSLIDLVFNPNNFCIKDKLLENIIITNITTNTTMNTTTDTTMNITTIMNIM